MNLVSTSYIERQNLTMRMSMRRFTRLTNAHSKKIENDIHAIALHYMYYSPQEAWLNEARDHWREQASGAFSAWIHPNLDEYLSSEARRSVILRLIDEVRSRSVVTPEAALTIEFLRRLILGEITTDASSPLDYMVSGEHPYEWWVRRNAEVEGH